MSTLSVPTEIYRPKRLPRVLRRQAALIRLFAFLGIAATFGLMVAWKNFTFQQLNIDIARQRTQLLQLDEELRHLNGLIEEAAPHNEIAEWAQTQHGWKLRADRVDTVYVKSPPKTPPAPQ